MARSTEKSLEQLHNNVTKKLATRLRADDCTTADIRAAIEWCKVNSITGVPADDTPLKGLSEVLSNLDFAEIEAEVM